MKLGGIALSQIRTKPEPNDQQTSIFITLESNLFMTIKQNFIAIVAVTLAATTTTGVNAQEVFGGVGLPGLATIGYAAPINDQFGWHAQFAGGLKMSLDGNRDGVNAVGSLKSTSLGLFGNWFPFTDSGFRIAGGISVNDIQASLKASGSGATTINGVAVDMTGQYYNSNLTFPTVTPYIGIGYGHQKTDVKGLGFYADLGVLVGSFSVKTDTSLVTSGQVTQSDVDAQSKKLRDGVASVGVLPSVSIGVVYRY